MYIESVGQKRGNGTARVNENKLHTSCRQIMHIELQEPFLSLLKI